MERVGPTHILCELGVNGLSAGFATWSSHLLGTGTKGAWGSLAAFGVPIYQTTITPQTTSSDAWATVNNQTVASAGNETARLAANAWLRDGAPISASPAAGGTVAAVGASGVLRAGQTGHPLAGIIEVADLAESARDSGKWKAGYTGDGTHPNATGAAALAAALVPATLGLVAAA
jgi:lysophospholipase L1-like esterase